MKTLNYKQKDNTKMVLSDKEYIQDKIRKLYDSKIDLHLKKVISGEYIVEIIDNSTNLIKEVNYINIKSQVMTNAEVCSVFKYMEDAYKKSYSGIDYKIISKQGFVEKVSYEEFGLKLYDFSYFDTGIHTVDLIAHNQYTYTQVQSFLDMGINDICSVQPTGTGKSFLIGRYVCDFERDRVLILSPSTYILEQFKNNFSWMKNNPNIRMMTYAKLSFLSEDEWEDLLKFKPNSICVDEYHRLGASSWGDAYKQLISRLKEDAKIVNLKTFGVTATPRRFLDKNRDMSSELFDGNVANEITLYDAIAKSILPMPKYVTVFHDISIDVKRLKEKIAKSKRTSSERAFLRTKLKEIVKKWTTSLSVIPIIQKYVTNERKFIIFCESQEHVEEMMVKCKEWFEVAFNNEIPVKTYKMLSSYRNSAKEFEEFENATNDKFNLLFSINAINEGVHPNIDAVIFCRNTTSGIVYYQQQGRCFKVGTGKTPLVLDLVNNAYNIGCSSFESKVKESIANENNRRSEFGLSPVDDYVDYTHSISDESQEVLRMFADLEDRLVISWDESFLKAEEYFRAHNHIYVEKSEDEHLYSWLSKMRTLYKNRKLSEEKIEKLKTLNFDFELKDFLFNKHFIKLEKFFAENNHSRVPSTYLDPSLFNWVTMLRYKYTNNELEEWQIEKLNTLDFVWNVNDLEWDLAFEELRAYYEEHGHSNVTNSNAPTKLVNFRNNNKKLFAEGRLSEERIKLLQTVDFDFSRQEDYFNSRVSEYREYINTYGTPIIDKSKNHELHSWFAEVKKKHKKGILPKEKVEALDELGVIWDIYEHRWMLKFKEMKDHYKKYKTLEVKVRSEFETLYKWMQLQRREYESGKMSEKRKAILDEFDFMNKIVRQNLQ